MSDQPNILIYFIDELRADALGCYGHPFVRTPNIDKIADEGLRCEQAISNCPLCMPARNSFFTGLYPTEHGITCNNVPEELEERHGKNPPTYAFGRLLREAGYQHIVNVGKTHTGFSPEISGFTEHLPAPDALGFGPPKVPGEFDEDALDVVRIPGEPPNTIIAGHYPNAGETTHSRRCADTAIKKLDELSGSDQPWALRVSINRPHTPVLPPPPYDTMYEEESGLPDFSPEEFDARTPLLERWSRLRGFVDIPPEEQRRARASYFGLISHLDAQIGRVEEHLDELGLGDDVITVFVADHGASIGDHGLQVKGPFDTDDIARVPLLIRYPDGIAPGEYSHLTQIIDLVPTLADLLNVPTPQPCSGSSLQPALEDPSSRIHDAVFSTGTWPHSGMGVGRRDTIRTPDHLYTRYPKIGEAELFDLHEDPSQTRNIADSRPRIVSDLEKRLDRWHRQHGELLL